nr:uncharacterized protein LOC123755630 [Procambarus clarkii]
MTETKQEKEGRADCIFLDCQKAFATVPHERHLLKLEKQAWVSGSVLRNWDTGALLELYTTKVRPTLEYVAPAWNSYLKKYKDTLEKVERYATKFVTELKGLSYEERLRVMDFTTLKEMRNREDIAATYKILREINKLDKTASFKARNRRTRDQK